MPHNQLINEHFPTLELDKMRFRVKYCPCGKGNKDGKFVPFVGYENYGYCHSCGETLMPELTKTGQRKPKYLQQETKAARILQSQPISYIPTELLNESLIRYGENNFAKFLCASFGKEITTGLIEKYFLGTSKHWNGATVFWQIDIQGKIRTGKIMLYNSISGKRIKEPYPHINWVHKLLNIENYKQCFFGEHLLNGNTKPIAIVESEKTAIITSIYLPEFLWLAVGSLNNLSAEKCKILQGQNVTLFPDLNCFEKWNDKAKELIMMFPGTRVQVFDLLERKATEAERKQGLDIADYLIRFDYRTVQQPDQHTPPPPELKQPQPKETIQEQETDPAHSTPLTETETFSFAGTPEPGHWQTEITELETFYKNSTLPTGSVKINSFNTITDIPQFIQSHLKLVKANNGKRFALPYLERLQELKHFLAANN